MGCGAIVGLLAGTKCQNLKPIGDIYIGLMQMTVLPYIVFSLIGNIGRLSSLEARQLARSSFLIFIGLWAISSVTVLILSLSFPETSSGRFFSSSMINPPEQKNLLELFIPSNPFKALSDNSVPAVVLFCLLFGAAIIGFEEKSSLISHITLITKALYRVNGFIVRLTPIGVFGIAANTIGTMSLEELERLQGYYLAFGLCATILTLIILPLVASTFTPFTYRQIISASKNALLTAFVTGSVFPVIPILIDGVHDLFKEQFRKDPRHKDFPDFILPLAYPFPNSGNVVDIVFISFSAWFIGNSLSFFDQTKMLFISFFLLFGKVYLTIPFLLNMYHVPEDMFQLFLAAGVLAARVGDVVSSMHFLVFAILTTSAMTGLLKVDKKRCSFFIVVSAINLIIATSICNKAISALNTNSSDNTPKISQMSLKSKMVQHEIIDPPSKNPIPLTPFSSRLERIKSRGRIRIGFLPDNLPYSFKNQRDELVGFDVDLSFKLAHDLGVGIEFIPYNHSDLVLGINNDYYDIAISGITDSLLRSSSMLMTDPYLTVSLGFVVKDHDRDRFSSANSINNIRHLRIGVTKGSYFESRIAELFPRAEIVPLDKVRDFFDDGWRNIDALATHAESGAAWTLIYPAFSVINPLTRNENAPISIAVSGFDVVLDDTLNTWIRLQRMEGFLDVLYDHWFLGKDPVQAITLPMLLQQALQRDDAP